MDFYEFNITIFGKGENPDEAFEDALKKLRDEPSTAISDEVIYTKRVKIDEKEQQEN
tara:strand:- start:1559 stop:1729 length:171 start_codon:yes stop_codon:yes gene_type:complete